MANDYNTKRKNFNRKSKEELEADQEVYLAHQRQNLKVLEDISAFLDNFLKTSTFYRVNMKEILTHLSDNGYNVEDTKAVSQLNYLLMDLTNARKNRNIDEHRLDIRVIYIKERFQTYFKSEFHEQIDKMFSTYDTLFALSEPQQTKGDM